MNDSTSAPRPRILIVGDAVAPTGFARVMENIFRPLCEDYEIFQLGLNYSGDPHELPWPIYPAQAGGDTWGLGRLLWLMGRVQPQLLFILNDVWVQGGYMEKLNQLESRPPIVMYCPVDAGPIDPETVARLEGIDACAAYTQYGKGQIEDAIAGRRQEKPDFEFPAVEVVPHGVDTDAFYPLSEVHEQGKTISGRVQARRKLFPGVRDVAERFIVLNANRNQPRKRIDVTIAGFARFARNKPESVKLFLHMGVQDLGWDIVQLAKRYQIEDHLLLSGMDTLSPSVSQEQMNLIYNACDVGLNTSSGEGWGLVSFEHAATGAAQIVPRHTACAELWDGAAVMLEPNMKLIMPKIHTHEWLVTPDDVAAALEKLYEDRQLLADMSDRAYRTATRPAYRWQAIAGRWKTVFEQLLGEDLPTATDTD